MKITKIIQWIVLAFLIPITLWLAHDRITLYTSSTLYEAEIVSCEGKQFKVISYDSPRRHFNTRFINQFQYAPVAISKDGLKGVGNFWLSNELCKRTIGTKVNILVDKDRHKGSIYSFTHFLGFPLFFLAFTLLFLVFEKSRLFNQLLFITFISGSAYFLAKEYNYFPANNYIYTKPLSAIEKCIKTSLVKEGVNLPEEIKRLDCRGRNIKDLSSLSNLSSLEHLQLQNNQLTSLETMPLLTNLKEIHLSGMKKLVSLEGVSQLPNLEVLVSNKSAIKDIADLENLIHLKKLELMMNKVSDISSLINLSKLTRVVLNYNPITSIEELANKPQLTWLELHSTGIKSIVPLYSNTNLKVVGISGAEGSSCNEFDTLKNLLSPNAKIYKHKYCK